jgi:hypothetical protein
MLQFIKHFLHRVFNQPSGVEVYIASKHPQTAGDVDHWMRVYQQHGGRYGC